MRSSIKREESRVNPKIDLSNISKFRNKETKEPLHSRQRPNASGNESLKDSRFPRVIDDKEIPFPYVVGLTSN